MRWSSVIAAAGLLTLAGAGQAVAGTQNFQLINKTGVEIHNLYISETGNEDWEEDVLGDRTLPTGGRMNIQFSGRSACLWDMMVADEEGGNLAWTEIDLCELSVVVLKCNDDECWAEGE